MEVPVIVRLGERTLSVGEVLDLTPGSIIELYQTADTVLDLLVNDKKVAEGTAVKIGENFGIQITSVGERVDRVDAIKASAA